MKFVLLAEGDAEVKILPRFLKGCLDPQLREPVRILPVNMGGWSKHLKDVPRKAIEYLTGYRSDPDIIAVISLLDLYGPQFYPSGKTGIRDRYEWGQREVEGRVKGGPRFRHFFAVHELEAWLLSAPDIFPRPVAEVVAKWEQMPEEVNFTHPPKARLKAVFRSHMRRDYKETVDGVTLFSKLDPSVACKKCPFLKAMIDDLVVLAKAVGL